MNIDNLVQLKRKDNLVIRKLDDVYYLLCGQDAYEVNETAATIVNALGRDLPVDELYAKLSEKYEFGDLEQIKTDVEFYLSFLLSEGLAVNE